ncbi:MAG: glycosyltransferase family 2 protein [Candidatus Limnocylindria bacterium]
MQELPAEVARLLERRAAARAERDWTAADALRDEIRSLGWEPVDAAGGSTARPAAPPSSAELPSLLDAPASLDASLVVVVDDHPDDLARLLRGLAAHPPHAAWELLVVANAPAAPIDELLAAAWPRDPSLAQPIVLAVSPRRGWADAVNLGLRRSRGGISILLDTSLEPTGDAVGPLLGAFADPRVGIAGGWGVTSEDGREFGEAPPGPVDAIEAYCLAIRREALRAVGGFDPHFRFYRHADLDLSFAVRDAGWQAIRTEQLPFERHEHRGWEAHPADERDRLSKRNFYRFLKRWRDRRDLLLRAG